jgi:hypothetical protein
MNEVTLAVGYSGVATVVLCVKAIVLKGAGNFGWQWVVI